MTSDIDDPMGVIPESGDPAPINSPNFQNGDSSPSKPANFSSTENGNQNMSTNANDNRASIWLQFKFKGTPYDIPFSSEDRLDSLFELLSEMHSGFTRETFKIVHKGKKLDPMCFPFVDLNPNSKKDGNNNKLMSPEASENEDMTPASSSNNNISGKKKTVAKVLILGHTETELNTIRDKKADPLVKGFAAEEKDLKARKRRERKLAKAAGAWHGSKMHKEYCFQKITPEFKYNKPTPYEAESLLKKLAHDPAIVKIMTENKFTVGLLTEMSPQEAQERMQNEGKNGVDLLGYNQGNGMKIVLRLRTDDADTNKGGFRPYYDLINTLIHELTHNVWSAHDENFWNLFRQLKREYDKFHDGYSRGGKTLMGGDQNTERFEGFDNDSDSDAEVYVLGRGDEDTVKKNDNSSTKNSNWRNRNKKTEKIALPQTAEGKRAQAAAALERRLGLDKNDENDDGNEKTTKVDEKADQELFICPCGICEPIFLRRLKNPYICPTADGRRGYPHYEKQDDSSKGKSEKADISDISSPGNRPNKLPKRDDSPKKEFSPSSRVEDQNAKHPENKTAKSNADPAPMEGVTEASQSSNSKPTDSKTDPNNNNSKPPDSTSQNDSTTAASNSKTQFFGLQSPPEPLDPIFLEDPGAKWIYDFRILLSNMVVDANKSQDPNVHAEANLKLLLKLITNLIEKGADANSKVRELKASNARIAQFLYSSPAAVKLLESVGFRNNNTNANNMINNSTVLKVGTGHYDVGKLFMAKEVLETALTSQ